MKFIGNLHPNSRKNELRDLFASYGMVVPAVLISVSTRIISAFGFIEIDGNVNAHLDNSRLNRLNFMNRFMNVHEVHQKTI